MQAWFAAGAALYVLFHRKDARVLTREYACAAVCAWFGIPVAWEAHRGEWNWLVRSALASGAHMVVISQGLKNFYISKGVAPDTIWWRPTVPIFRVTNICQAKRRRAARSRSRKTKR